MIIVSIRVNKSSIIITEVDNACNRYPFLHLFFQFFDQLGKIFLLTSCKFFQINIIITPFRFIRYRYWFFYRCFYFFIFLQIFNAKNTKYWSLKIPTPLINFLEFDERKLAKIKPKKTKFFASCFKLHFLNVRPEELSNIIAILTYI